MNVTVLPVTTPEQMSAARRIRREVFIDEQGVKEAEEMDGRDDAPSTRHVLAFGRDQTAIGTARLLVDRPGLVHIGRVAVLPRARGRGIGTAIMTALEQLASAEHADATGQVRIELSAQESALDFYRNLGYEIAPDRYLDARIWHQDAHKTLTVHLP
ncbi:MAG TPA: GNAT family N-acetyltransferase [Beutenbergiaceae bacterium]|nr:GNAT family N-acetyltransferase [Beutenbergiaceae bacterium]